MKRIFLLFIITSIAVSAYANVRLPKFFGDGMVLQRDQPITVWGWADTGEKITVHLSAQTQKTRAGKDGRWKVVFAAMSAGGPHALTVSGKNSITLNDVLMGDVWICSGQSNMEWPVAATKNAAKEIDAANFPQIRHIGVQKSVSATPLNDLSHETSWKQATQEHVGSFTAVGYFFARKLYQELGVPIGLIHASWGGTDVETWTSREAFEGSTDFREMIQKVGTIDLENLSKKREQAVMQNISKMQNGLPQENETNTWKENNFDDADWKQMALPALWESSVLPDMDGAVWFRKTVTLTAAQAAQPAVLHLAQIDDADETFVNGVLVGATNAYNTKRIYNIKPGLLKEGRNVIAVHVTDVGGGGGIFGDAEDLKLQTGTETHTLAGDWKLRVASVAATATIANPNSYPTLLYNAMIHPLLPYGIKGVIWYQGENNAGRAYEYRKAFPLMINDWRKQWGKTFPFYFVQLASFDAAGGNSEKGSAWAELREAQTLTLQLPQTGMAVTTDIGDPKDIHPINKQDVGARLATIALAQTYGKGNVYSGPVFQSMQKNGARVILQFTSTGSGLMTPDKYGYIKGFEVAGEDQKFHYAKASIEGGDKIILQSAAVASPVAVRFAWSDDTNDANLFNKEGLPAVPFRTDDWKMVTRNNKYSR